MSRVIKFRCWNAFANHMHDWNEMVEKNKIHLLGNENKSYVCEQFTGLTDKNGVEIYEGDILRSKSYGSISIVEVSHLDGGYVVNGRSIKNVKINSKYVVGYEFEVIGNIHQNPELLK